MCLSRAHEYYDQVQGQLAVCEVEYCDFICWTPCGIHYERIVADTQYFFSNVKPSLDTFFISVLLPRLLTGSSYESTCTRPCVGDLPYGGGFCWCGGEDEGRMVACDNISCLREWFHYQCV